jgi:hypothetical protein
MAFTQVARKCNTMPGSCATRNAKTIACEHESNSRRPEFRVWA